MSEEKKCFECEIEESEFNELLIEFEGQYYCSDCLKEISEICENCEERKRKEDFDDCSRCGKRFCYECMSDEYPWRTNASYCENCMSVFLDLIERWANGDKIDYDPEKNGETIL